jgi:hypothetical protein
MPNWRLHEQLVAQGCGQRGSQKLPEPPKSLQSGGKRQPRTLKSATNQVLPGENSLIDWVIPQTPNRPWGATILDDRCPQCHAKGVCRCNKANAEFCREVVLQLIAGNEVSQLDPAIITTEFANKREKEVFKRELMPALT